MSQVLVSCGKGVGGVGKGRVCMWRVANENARSRTATLQAIHISEDQAECMLGIHSIHTVLPSCLRLHVSIMYA